MRKNNDKSDLLTRQDNIMSYLNHSNYSVITLDGNGNSTLIEDLNSNPYDENLMNGLVYFGVSLLFGVPILMFLLCVYKMRGDPPCDNLKEACCCDFC
jgi:hypothetical protein